VGNIENTALIEVPMGTTLSQIVYEIGGGIPEGRACKAIQTGGPSGGCIPADRFDLPVDYDSLSAAGSIMGSGGMIVMDDQTCMVDIAKYFLGFLEDESCGKCFSCREGTQRLKAIVEKISQGKGSEEDLDLLQDLGWMVREVSLCGLGQTAANPVLSTMRYFRNEYLEHIRNRRCPAKVCRELITYAIDPVTCNGCGACVQVCSGKAILGEKKKVHTIEQGNCTKCGACLEICKFDAVLVN
jgi:NADP-reducing hydrogenase subunit HndC